MHAIQEYERRSGRMSPTWCEVLEVLRGLGYDSKSGNLAHLAWIPMEGKLINNHWFDLREKPEDFRIFSIGTVRASQDR